MYYEQLRTILSSSIAIKYNYIKMLKVISEVIFDILYFFLIQQILF